MKKKAKSIAKSKSSWVLSTDKAYSSTFYFVISSHIYDTIYFKEFIVELILDYQYLDKIKSMDVNMS